MVCWGKQGLCIVGCGKYLSCTVADTVHRPLPLHHEVGRASPGVTVDHRPSAHSGLNILL